jgi:DNA replication and repair protein RecF
VHYLGLGASHRVASDQPLVRAGCEAAVIRGVARLGLAGSGRRLTVELELRPGGRNRARLNGQPQPRHRDALGQVRTVLFAPEDLELVRGDPAARRRFLDDLLAQRRPAYRAARQEYERVLRQRNSLLRTLRARGHPDGGMLAVWTDALASAGATLLAARVAVVHALAAPLEDAYRDLVAASPAREASGAVGVAYLLSTGRRVDADPGGGVPDPAVLAAELREGLAAVAPAEAERGLTLAGPHRDELELSLNGLPARGYASHGETWSLALALRLASREVLAAVGEQPVVLLDDVFAELDEHRRKRLAGRCLQFEQVLVTAAVDDDVPLPGPRYAVRDGAVSAQGGGS